MIARPSGDDALPVREAYLRRARSGRTEGSPLAAVWWLLVVGVCVLGSASFAVFIFGS